MSLFKFNPRVLPAIATHPVVIAQLKVKADAVAERARAIAPVRRGNYRDGIKSESGIVDGMGVGRVNANDFKSHLDRSRHLPTPPRTPCYGAH